MAEIEEKNVETSTQETEFKSINSKEELDKYLNQEREKWKVETQTTIANERKRYEEKTKKLEKEIELSKLSEEEKTKKIQEDARKEQEEKFNSMQQELDELRKEKRNSEIKSKLLENGLPNRYLNDIRLINSEEYDKTIKDLLKEYDSEKATLLKSSIKDTSPSVPNKTTTQTKEDASMDRMRRMMGIK